MGIYPSDLAIQPDIVGYLKLFTGKLVAAMWVDDPGFRQIWLLTQHISVNMVTSKAI